MIKKISNWISKLFLPAKPVKIVVLTYNVGGQKLYFSNKRKSDINFCTLLANAWWFSHEDVAKELKQELAEIYADYRNLKVEFHTLQL